MNDDLADAPVHQPVFTAPAKTEAAAIVAFILALCSIVVPIIPAIVAVGLATGAKRNVDASNATRRGIGLSHAAQIIAGLTIFGYVVVAMLLAWA